MSIFIYKNGQQYGPYEPDEVKGYVANGTLSEADLAWYEGLDDWMSLQTVLSNFFQNLTQKTKNLTQKTKSLTQKTKKIPQKTQSFAQETQGLTQESQNQIQKTVVIRAFGRGESKKFKAVKSAGEDDPVSIPQRCKLNFYGVTIKEGLTRGEADLLIEEAESQHPELVKNKLNKYEKDSRIELWREQIMSSDLVFAGEMRAPNETMITETIHFLDRSKKNWTDSLTSNELAALLLERYPTLKK